MKELPMPKMIGLSANHTLDPYIVRNGAYGVAKYPGMLESDLVTMTWSGIESSPAARPGNPGHGVVAIFEPKAIAKTVSRDVTLQYSVTDNAGAVRTSQPLVFKHVFTDHSLPKIELELAMNGVLDLRDIPQAEGVTVLFPAWPLINQAQRIWLTLNGISLVGAPLSISLLTAVLVPPLAKIETATGFSLDFPLSEFAKLKDGSEFTLSTKVTFAQSETEAQGVSFVPLSLTIVNTEWTEVQENFDGQPDQTVIIGEPIILKTLTAEITYTQGQSLGGIRTLESVPGFREGPALMIGLGEPDSCVMTVTLTRPCNRIRFATSLITDAAFQSVLIRDVDSSQLANLPLFDSTYCDFTAPPGRQIKYLNLAGKNHQCFDFFTLFYK